MNNTNTQKTFPDGVFTLKLFANLNNSKEPAAYYHLRKAVDAGVVSRSQNVTQSKGPGRRAFLYQLA